MNIKFTDKEINSLKLTQEDMDMATRFADMLEGGESSVRMNDFLATPSAQVLIPKVVIGAMREVAEPMYVGSKYFDKVRIDNGSSMIIPSHGALRAHFVAEGQETPGETLDVTTAKNTEIRVGKAGVRVAITDEMISDSQWDVVSMTIREAGRAMARLKEEMAFKQMSKHGHTVFDAFNSNPEAKPTGLGKDGKPNDTMSAEDLLDVIIAVMNNEFTPTDILLHPLTWSVFAKNELMGSIAGNPYGNYPHTNQPGSMELGPDSISGRLPFGFNVQTSPFIPFDKEARRYEMFVVDRNNVGVELVREEMSTEEFRDPARDIKNIKIKERYGLGVKHGGRGIAVVKNISMNKTYNEPVLTKSI